MPALQALVGDKMGEDSYQNMVLLNGRDAVSNSCVYHFYLFSFNTLKCKTSPFFLKPFGSVLVDTTE